jgi:uncharacterized iron-regulated membrane protein
MARSRAKRWFGFIHLWVGLITGIIVFLISITGCIYVFRDELFTLAHKDVLFNNVVEKQPTLPIDSLWNMAQQHVGAQYPLEDGTAYLEPNRNWEFIAGKYHDSVYTYFQWIEYDYVVYINPYTGKVAGIINHKYEFFQIIKMLHWSLLLHTDYGQPIVGVAVLLFVVSLISGIVIWWPSKLKQFKEHLKVKWKAQWRRINYDIHRATAVYVLPIALIIAITGLVWAFKTVQAIVYVAASQSITPPDRTEPKSVYDTTTVWLTNAQLLNHIVTDSWKQFPDAYSVHFHPADYADTTHSVSTYIRANGMVYYDAALNYYDQYSGKLVKSMTFDKLNRGEKMLYMNYDIHVGAILGIPGKILAFIVSLICASLPITGFMIYWGKRTVAQQKEAKVRDEEAQKALQHN